MENRTGRQEPTLSLVLPYQKTDGAIAVQLYNLTGRTAMPWQESLIYDILAKDENGLWVHSHFGYSIPRRNGKGEILVMRELYALAVGEKVLHTAHRTSTSHSAWERLCSILDMLKIEYRSIRAKGQETIKIKGGGEIFFRTRTAKGGLGEGFDLLVIDEAQEYQVDQESTLKYIVTSSKNPQTIMCGTPPTPISSGTVFRDYRSLVLSGGSSNAGWAEWSVEELSDVHDRNLWYETSPSLGYTLTERNVADEIGDTEEKIIDFNIQRLGLWLSYNQKSQISDTEWRACLVTALPKFSGKPAVGIKASKKGNVSVSIAIKTNDGKIFVEAISCRSLRDGLQWVEDFCLRIGNNAHKIVIDGKAIQETLEADLTRARLKNIIIPNISEVITANAQFEQAIVHQTICHMDQPGLSQAISNCVRRAIGSNGGFGFESTSEHIDISLMDSCLLAAWAIANIKEKKPIYMSY